MKVSIFQPTYLPWLGFFKAISWADKFVFLDDVQFENHSWQSRNRIKSSGGDLVLTVPIVRKFPQKLSEVRINYSQNWQKSHLKSIQFNYSKSVFFNDFFPHLEKIINSRPDRLIDLDIAIIKEICGYLGITGNFHLSSEFNTTELHKNEKIISLLVQLKADHYLYAQGAAEYMQPALKDYEANHIKLSPLKFEHPVYGQLYGPFISHLSIIDMIFNCGPKETIDMINDINL